MHRLFLAPLRTRFTVASLFHPARASPSHTALAVPCAARPRPLAIILPPLHPSSSRSDFFLSSRPSLRSFNPTPDPPSSVLSPTAQTVLRGLPPVNDPHSQHFALAAGRSSTPRPRMPRGLRISG
ncbi:hypothetical protein K438DRAFT_1994070 [Mycena galopus ATCC 62051]|nr:hypothetical protein K438DRAFT_1994070 [Mycena galopus ATCC 62051]